MKSKTQISVVILLVGVFSQPLSAEDQANKAQALIDRCISVMGGKKALMKTQRQIIKDKGTYYGMGDGLPYEGRFVHDVGNPGRYRMEIQGQFVSVCSDGKAWASVGGQTTDSTGQALEVALQGNLLVYASSLIPLAKPNKEFKVSLAKSETIEGEECSGVKVERKKMPTLTIQFSKKTGLIKATEFKAAVAELNFKKVVERTVIHEYKTFDGFLSATKMTMYRDGKKLVESNPYEVSFPKKLDDKEFKKPE